MGLNKSTGNMYEFVTYTWNTIKGACPHDCSYCYMKRWGKLNPVRFDKNELKTDLGQDNFIFVGSSCDMFADDIPAEWIKNTIFHCGKFDNQYLFQSKNPGRMLEFPLCTLDCVVCTTIETNRWYPDIMHNSPSIEMRAAGMLNLHYYPRYVTIEPILDFDLDELVDIIKLIKPVQVNIGADSGKNGLPEPSIEMVKLLIEQLQTFTTISKKRNLERLEKK